MLSNSLIFSGSLFHSSLLVFYKNIVEESKAALGCFLDRIFGNYKFCQKCHKLGSAIKELEKRVQKPPRFNRLADPESNGRPRKLEKREQEPMIEELKGKVLKPLRFSQLAAPQSNGWPMKLEKREQEPTIEELEGRVWKPLKFFRLAVFGENGRQVKLKSREQERTNCLLRTSQTLLKPVLYSVRTVYTVLCCVHPVYTVPAPSHSVRES